VVTESITRVVRSQGNRTGCRTMDDGTTIFRCWRFLVESRVYWILTGRIRDFFDTKSAKNLASRNENQAKFSFSTVGRYNIAPPRYILEILKRSITMAISSNEKSCLSVDAAPFFPSGFCSEPLNIMVYNDGQPSMTCGSEKDLNDILHGIDDEALDAFFPPDAGEAFELESTEVFVREMATLAMLEELEERARRTMCHLEKRWEVRRAAGLAGRPRPAMHAIEPVKHNVKIHPSNVTTLSFHRMDRRSMSRLARSVYVTTRNQPRLKVATAPIRPIVQPRKNS
jgi:hypothetical protein